MNFIKFYDFHETLAIRSFENGKHVLLEKPMAHDLNSALKILKHPKSSGIVFMIAENSQYWPEVNCVHDLLKKKVIGEVITVRASFRQNTNSDIFDSYNLLPGDQLDKAWRLDKKSSGGGITLKRRTDFVDLVEHDQRAAAALGREHVQVLHLLRERRLAL